MGNCYIDLPEGYSESMTVDLQKDKKLSLVVNGIGLVVTAVCVVIGILFVPFSALFGEGEPDFADLFIKLAVLGVGTVVYVILHELTHAVVMKAYGAPKIKFGFTGLYAYAGSDCWFAKVPYIVIALAPVVLWGVVLGVVCALVPADWFWPIYFIQILNLGGAGGDIYVTYKFSKMPADILLRDVGTSMTVYSK